MKSQEILEAYPELIVRLEGTVTAKRALLDVAKAELEIAKSEAVRRNEKAKNQMLLKANVTLDDDVKAKVTAKIEAAEAYDGAVSLYNCAENALASAKKFANQGMLNAEIAVPQLLIDLLHKPL